MFRPNPKQFAVKELVPKTAIKRFGDNAIYLIDPLVLLSLQQLRNKFGRMVILNDYRQQSSLRTASYYGSDSAYANSYSMHKYGKALDIIPLDTPLDDIHDFMAKNPDYFPFIHFVEVGMLKNGKKISWLHIDTRNQPGMTFWSERDGTLAVYPQKPINWSAIVPGLVDEEAK